MDLLRSAVATAALLSCFSADRTAATDFDWDDGGANDLWDTLANWDPEDQGIPAGSSDTIILTVGSAAGPQTIDLNGSRSINEIHKNDVSGQYTFTNGTLEILSSANGLLQNSESGALQIDADVELAVQNDSVLFNVVNGSDQIIVNGNIESSAVSGTTELVLTSRDLSLDPSVLVTGIISDGTGGATLALNAGFADDALAHSGTIELTGLNTYTGQTAVHGARLKFNSIANLGAASALGAATGANGTIRLGAVDIISGTTGPTSGTLVYTGSGHSSNRDFELRGTGGVIEADATATGSLMLSGGAYSIEADPNGPQTFQLGGNSSFTNSISGSISDGVDELELVKTGSSTWVLSALNTYNGGTTLVGGTLAVSADNMLGFSALTFAGGTLRVTGSSFASTAHNINWQGGGFDIEDPNHTFTVNVGSAGTGSLTKIGEGNLVLTGANDYTGNTTIDAGRLHILGGSSVTNDSSGVIADSAGASATAIVDGTDPNGARSTWNSGFELRVGDDGNGALNISGGGLVISPEGFIADDPTATGTATVHGTDPNGNPSTWNSTSSLTVGNYGDGTLNITGGGLVTTMFGLIASDPNSTSLVIVDGTDSGGNPSTWSNSGFLTVGSRGNGTLEITGGGLVTSIDALVANLSSSTGTVTVDGADANGNPSTWNNSSSLFVGFGGTGTLDITGGGLVTSTTAIIGNDSNGMVTVDGVDPNNGNRSTWNNSGSLTVGNLSTGTLDITGGGLVTSTTAVVGNEETGTATVEGSSGGSQSTWNNSGSLTVGDDQDGELNIFGGGLMTNGSAVIGLSGTGTVTVDGADPNNGKRSTWTNTGFLTVGYSDDGTLNIADGGVVNSAVGLIGANSNPGNPVGTVTVEGTDLQGNPSTWNNSLRVSVGESGSGVLNIANGGLVLSVSVDVATNDFGIGTVNIENGGTMLVDGLLTLGLAGTVKLNGGTLRATGIDLISYPGGDFNFTAGTLNVETFGGNLTQNGGTLVIGNSTGETVVTQNYSLNAGTLEIEIAGTLPSEFDTLTIGGNATLAGDLDVMLDPNFTLTPGNSFHILDIAGTTTGTFTGLPDGALVGNFNGVNLFIDYDDGVSLLAGLPGDFDFDGDVDGIDFLLWQRDPSIGLLSDWETNYGMELPPAAAAASQSVPEPSSLALLGFGAILLLRNRGGKTADAASR